MKKTLFSVVALLMCLMMFAACADSGSGAKEPADNDTSAVNTVTVSLSEALAKINEQYFDGGETMKLVETTDKLELYYDIAPQDVAEFAAEVAKNSATEINEVVLIKAVDEEAAKRVAEKLELRLNSQKDLCASYSPELLAIAEKSGVRTQGLLVSLIITDDYDAVTALCDEILFN